MRIRDYLKEETLLFDGAMGTYYALRYKKEFTHCELSNIYEPETVRTIHREYIEAGAKAVRTNTFAANMSVMNNDYGLLRRVIEEGFKLASMEAEGRAFVFADIGPLDCADSEDIVDGYRQIIDIFKDCHAENFIFETNSITTGLLEAAVYIRQNMPEAYIIINFAAFPDGYTADGVFYKNAIRELDSSGIADALGLNCISGARHMAELIAGLEGEGVKAAVSAMPNAGYPSVRGRRTYYDGDSEYFARQMLSIISEGASIIGGCCGTDPDYIRKINSLIKAGAKAPRIRPQNRVRSVSNEGNRILKKLDRGEKIIAVELDPPKSCNSESFMEGAGRLKEAGADMLTIADCPIARARMDSCLLSCKVKRELGMEVLPHMTCRDRNINATKALLLGINGEGIHNVLTITGDPIPTAERKEVESVYQFNSRKLAAYISSLNTEVFTEPMCIYGALNVNAVSFTNELKRAKAKIEAGIGCFLTQPVMSDAAFENLARAREELNVRILGGIIPIVSEKNARFMHNEVNGIDVPEDITGMYSGLERAEAEELAVRICREQVARMKPYTDGYYLITPFNRVELMEKIILEIKLL